MFAEVEADTVQSRGWASKREVIAARQRQRLADEFNEQQQMVQQDRRLQGVRDQFGDVIDRLVQRAPRSKNCFFLNCKADFCPCMIHFCD